MVPDGRVYEGQFFAVEFELGDGQVMTEAVVWGGEARPRSAR